MLTGIQPTFDNHKRTTMDTLTLELEYLGLGDRAHDIHKLIDTMLMDDEDIASDVKSQLFYILNRRDFVSWQFVWDTARYLAFNALPPVFIPVEHELQF